MAKRAKVLKKKFGDRPVPLEKGEKPGVRKFKMRGRRIKGLYQLKRATDIGFNVAHSEALGSTSQYTDEIILKEIYFI